MAIVIDHELKEHPEPFEQTWSMAKKHEVRYADREFHVGDAVLLREWNPIYGFYTGREILTEITNITEPGTWGLPPVKSRKKRGLVVFSHREILRRQERF